MGDCKMDSEPGYKVALLFASLGLGLCCSTVLALIFAYKWFTKLDKEYRKQKIPVLSAIIIIFICLERLMRIIEVRLRYGSSRLAVSIVYNINNVASFTGIFATILVLLTVRLSVAFKDSVYQLKKKEIRLFYALIFTDLILVYLLFISEGITKVNKSYGGRILQVSLATIILVIALLLLGKLNLAFASRLRALVASHTIECRMSADERKRSQNYSKLDKQSHHLDVPHTLDERPVVPKVISMDTIDIVKQSQFQGFKHSTVSSFDDFQQDILKTAAKTTVFAVWMTLTFLLLFTASLFFAVSMCASFLTSFGHIVVGFSYIVIALSISFSLPHSEREYHVCCSHCDQFVSKLVAWQTTRKVLKLHMRNSNGLKNEKQ